MNVNMGKGTFEGLFVPAEEGGGTAFAREVLGAITQGEMLDEAKANLVEAIGLILETNREQLRREFSTLDVITAPVLVDSGDVR